MKRELGSRPYRINMGCKNVVLSALRDGYGTVLEAIPSRITGLRTTSTEGVCDSKSWVIPFFISQCLYNPPTGRGEDKDKAVPYRKITGPVESLYGTEHHKSRNLLTVPVFYVYGRDR